jgi:serine/threonine-protein kinase SRPK3
VLFEITGLQDWTEDEIYRYLGPPKTAPLLLLDGTPAPAFAPTHVVDALDYSHLNMEHLSSNVLITDFGEAFFKDNVPKGLGTPASFSAPELLFGYQPSCAVDLWALGCLIFEIHTFRVLIPTIFGSDQEALAMAIETVGALPEAWQDSFYDKDNSLEAENPGKKRQWFDDQIQRTRTLDSQILEELPGLSQHQHATFLQLLKSILVFEPSRRLPAAEVTKHPWCVCE